VDRLGGTQPVEALERQLWDRLVQRHAQHVWDVCRASALSPAESSAACELVWLRLAGAVRSLGSATVPDALDRLAAQECRAAHLRAGRTADGAGRTHERRRLDRP